MLLGNIVLKAAAARAWLHREAIEHEAAARFSGMAARLRALGASPGLVERAERAASDESEHAARCRRIVEQLDPGQLAPAVPGPPDLLGPHGLSERDRLVYEAVAVSCVTETLSAAILVEMRAIAREPLVADTINHILRDEIEHARFGWSVLASAGEAAWLTPFVPAMLREAVRADAPPRADGFAAEHDLSSFGILPRPRIEAIVEAAVSNVIVPGLARYGVVIGRASAASAG